MVTHTEGMIFYFALKGLEYNLKVSAMSLALSVRGVFMRSTKELSLGS